MDDAGILPIWPFRLFCGYLVYSVAIWYILWLYGIFSPLWYVAKKNLATLIHTSTVEKEIKYPAGLLLIYWKHLDLSYIGMQGFKLTRRWEGTFLNFLCHRVRIQ
jgi:hypothetical protein